MEIEKYSYKPGESLDVEEQRALEGIEQSLSDEEQRERSLDIDRDRLVKSPSEEEYWSALDPTAYSSESSPVEQWRQVRENNRMPAGTQEKITLPTSEEMAVRQRFVELTRHHEKVVKRENEIRHESKAFAAKRAPRGLRGYLARMKEFFFHTEGGYARVPPVTKVMGGSAVVSAAILPMQYGDVRQ